MVILLCSGGILLFSISGFSVHERVHISVGSSEQASQLNNAVNLPESVFPRIFISLTFLLEMVTDIQQPLTQLPPDTASPLLILPPPVPAPGPALRPIETPVIGAPGMGSVSTEPDDEEGLKHLEQVNSCYSFLSPFRLP